MDDEKFLGLTQGESFAIQAWMKENGKTNYHDVELTDNEIKTITQKFWFKNLDIRIRMGMKWKNEDIHMT